MDNLDFKAAEITFLVNSRDKYGLLNPAKISQDYSRARFLLTQMKPSEVIAALKNRR